MRSQKYVKKNLFVFAPEQCSHTERFAKGDEYCQRVPFWRHF